MNIVCRLRSRVPVVTWLLVTPMLALLGCSGGGLEGLYPVTGIVTYQGAPVDGATITFVGEGDARPATAVSKPDGTYELYTLGTLGAAPGKYSVAVAKTEALPESANADLGFSASGEDLSMEQAARDVDKPLPAPKELLPAKYNNPGSTPLKFDVKDSGSNVIDLKLEN